MRVFGFVAGAVLGWIGSSAGPAAATGRNDVRDNGYIRGNQSASSRKLSSEEYHSIVESVIAALADSARRQARAAGESMTPEPAPTVIRGDLVVTGRVGIGGPPETDGDALTIHGKGGASILLLANESLNDPQRIGGEHRHAGSVGVAEDGGLRLNQNLVCYPAPRSCVGDDVKRRVAAAGFDSMGDMSFSLAELDPATGRPTTPNTQSLVLRLIDWDGNIHIVAYRPRQRIFFNGSTTLRASDLFWEVPLAASK
jgi:hypothetical protein